MPNVVFARIRRLQKVDEILNEFRRTRLVSRAVGGRTEREVRWVGGEWDLLLRTPLCLQWGWATSHVSVDT